MFNQSKDVPGQCNARLYIADDYGDNRCTMRCMLPKGHEGRHREEYDAFGDNHVVVEWDYDERRGDEPEEGEKSKEPK